MYTTINESLGKEKLTIACGAATVGRPSGVNGKKMAPRRARVSKKELDKLTTKGYVKAGGPGSGRHTNSKVISDMKDKVKKSFGDKVTTYKGYDIHKTDDGKFGTKLKGKVQSWGHPKLSDAKQFVRADKGQEDYAQ